MAGRSTWGFGVLAQGMGKEGNMGYCVYILRLANGQLYVGSTDNLARRIAEHQSGDGGRTTALFSPSTLLYSEPHPDQSSALKRERQLKKWSRAKKLALINGDFDQLKNLASCCSRVQQV